MKNFLYIFVVLMFVIIADTFSQSGWTWFKNNDLPIKGLPFCIKSDFNGNVYLGMDCGLAKFDGSKWASIYNNKQNQNDANNPYNIRKVVVSKGRVWAGTNQGLISIELDSVKRLDLTNYPKMYDDKIRGIAGDQFGNIWFLNLTLGINKYDITGDSIVRYNIPQSTPLPFNNDAVMFCDGKNNLWYSAYSKMVKFDGTTVKIFDKNDISDLENESIQSIQIQSDNSIAILLKRKIGIYKDYTGVVYYALFSVTDSLLAQNEVFANVKADLEGNLWIISKDTAGVGASRHFYRLDNNKNWTKYEFPNFDGVYKDIFKILDFTIDENRKLWFAEATYGVFVFDSKATSVDEQIQKNKVLISPNPVSNYLTLNTDQEINKIEIFSALGIKVIETEYKNKINVSGLSAGVYFLLVNNKIYKFVKI
ncbi:MAG: T9SS type A sorting domain-containing protein [Ignavibacteriae bacterium]|nr:T9SS type A sorting domain-containing protein [Ignavibacteriota bacterium]